MTLRFFGRKGAKARTTREESGTDTSNDTTDNEPARRTVRRAAKPPETSTSSASAPDAPTNGGTKTTRSRRGRRGGVGRKKKTSVEAAPQEQPENVEPARGRAPSRPKPATVDGSRDGHATSLEELMQLQLEALKSVQGSLSSIENRLVGGGVGVGAGTDRPRLGIFVDVPNVMYAAERQKVKLDYGKLLDFLTRGRELVRASAYSPISDETGERFDTQRFVQPFANLGYRLVTKPHKRYADGSMKANFDVELALDVMVMSDRLDIVSLVSGDGDFRRLVELVAGKGVRVEVVAFSQSTAQELRGAADQYIDLNDHIATLKA